MGSARRWLQPSPALWGGGGCGCVRGNCNRGDCSGQPQRIRGRVNWWCSFRRVRKALTKGRHPR